MIHPVAAGCLDGLVCGRLGDGDHVKATGLAEGGNAFGVENGPARDEGTVVQHAVCNGALCLIHRNDHRSGRIGNAVVGEFLIGHKNLNVVAGEPFHHVAGRLEVGLVNAVERNDVALGVEVAVFAFAVILGTEQIGFGAFDIVLVAQPLTYEGECIGVCVVYAAAENLGLRLEVAELFVCYVVCLAEAAVLNELSACVVVAGKLNGVSNGALEHCKLRSVGCGHIVPGIGPVGGAVAVIGEVIALGDDVAVVGIVICNGCNAESLAACDQVICQQVVLKVRLVRGIAGLALERGDAAVELGEGYGVKGCDKLLHVLSFLSGLEGVIAVEVVAVGGFTGDVGTSFDVFLGNEDEEHSVEQLVDSGVDGLLSVVLIEVNNAGTAVFVGQPTEVGRAVLDKVGNGHFVCGLLAVKFGLTIGGEAGEVIVAELAVAGCGVDEHPCKFHDAVGRRDFVRVDVGEHHRNLYIVILAGLYIRKHLIGLSFCLLGELKPFGHGCLIFCDNEVGHVERVIDIARGLAHGILLHKDTGILCSCYHLIKLGVDLVHRVEAVVGSDLHGNRADNVALCVGRGEIEVAAGIEVSAAFIVGSAVVGVSFARPPVVAIEEVVGAELGNEGLLAV